MRKFSQIANAIIWQYYFDVSLYKDNMDEERQSDIFRKFLGERQINIIVQFIKHFLYEKVDKEQRKIGFQ